MGTQKQGLNETVLLSTQNIMLKLMSKKRKYLHILRSKSLFVWTCDSYLMGLKL